MRIGTFMQAKKIIMDGITFDDVLLVPQKSDVLPNEVDLKTQLTKKIKLNIPLLSAAMDTVTEHRMAIQIALLGGAGVIHKNLSIEKQVKEVKKVKAYRVAFDEPNFNPVVDQQKRLIVGAGVSTSVDVMERIEALVQAETDFVVVDSAHGHSQKVIDLVKKIKTTYPELQVIAGNIAIKEGAQALVEAGADAVKVGIGPGSICTTRIVAGVGVPQISAIMDVYEYCLTKNIPLIADGGIKYSGDIVKALGAGANVVMLGSILAGTTEAPGKEIQLDGKTYKTYVGMGSMAAMKRGSSDRYFQSKNQKLVPEGIESIVEVKGPVKNIVYQLMGGLRSGMGYTGNSTIDLLRENAKFTRISNAGLVESHPHDVRIFKQAPNYK